MGRVVTVVKKTQRYLRNKGLILTLLKIWDYFLFQINLRKNKFTPVILWENPVAVIVDTKNIKIVFQKDTICTCNSGFYLEIKNLGVWHSCSQTDWFLSSGSSKKVIIKQRWWNLPLEVFWKIKLENNRFFWEVTMDIENKLLVEEVKATVILNSVYDLLLFSSNEEINLKNPNFVKHFKSGSFILQSSNPENIYPDLQFSILDAEHLPLVSGEHKDMCCNIGFSFPEEKMYPSGKYKLISIMLGFLDDF